MPLALGLILLLPIIGALEPSGEIAELSTSYNNTIGDTLRENYPTGEQFANGYFVTRILPEGEVRRIIRWKGICAKETIVDWGHANITLREILLKESRRKLQLLYEGDTLTECKDEDYVHDDEDNCSFDVELNGDSKRTSIGETRIELLDEGSAIDDETLPAMQWLVSTDHLRDRCGNLKIRARRQLMAQQKHRRTERSLQQMVIAPGTKWCGPHRTANSYRELGSLDYADRCCRRHDHCYRSIPAFSERYNLWNYMPFTLSHCGCDERKTMQLSKDNNSRMTRRLKIMKNDELAMRKERRARSRKRRELLLIPGTQWCGRGNRATKYTNLGGFGKADSCCRRHDTACPLYIPAFDSRYGLFNWGVSTIMHCTCDERFRTCLKMAGTSSANFIGRIFFNVVQTKCFVLKPHKVCVRQNWWGKCEKHEYKKQAHLRDNVPY